MILKLDAISSDATLNNFSEIGSIKFVAGQSVKINLRIMQLERELRYVPEASATFSLGLKKSDNTTLTVPMNFLDAGDRSLLTVELTALQTTDLISQNITVTVTESSEVSLAVLQNGLQNTKLNGC